MTPMTAPRVLLRALNCRRFSFVVTSTDPRGPPGGTRVVVTGGWTPFKRINNDQRCAPALAGSFPTLSFKELCAIPPPPRNLSANITVGTRYHGGWSPWGNTGG